MNYMDTWESDVEDYAKAAKAVNTLQTVTKYDGKAGMSGITAPEWKLDPVSNDAVITLSRASAKGLVVALSPYCKTYAITIDENENRGAAGQHLRTVRIPRRRLLGNDFAELLKANKDKIQSTLLDVIMTETSASRSAHGR